MLCSNINLHNHDSFMGAGFFFGGKLVGSKLNWSLGVDD
jgi:hypothetical protein